MIKERCLLDLLEEEKEAVENYNELIENRDFIVKHYAKLLRAYPHTEEYCDKQLTDRLFTNKELEKLAVQKITSVRVEIKRYLSNL